ncbi:MAG: hypothetical protein ACFFD1_00325 [Candidatus Thorarchaeota archaeon]
MADSNKNINNLRDSKKFLYPILITIIMAALLTVMFKYTYYPNPGESPPNIAPIQGSTDVQNDPVGSIATGLSNALLYITIAIIGGFLLVFLIRTGKVKIIEILFASMMAGSMFLFGIIIFPAISFSLLSLFYNLFPDIAKIIPDNIAGFIINDLMFYLAGFIAILSFLVLGLNRFKSQTIHNLLMILFGSMMGMFLGIFIDTFILFFILIGFAIYDIYAVFFGPIKQMFSSDDKYSPDIVTTAYSSQDKEQFSTVNKPVTDFPNSNLENIRYGSKEKFDRLIPGENESKNGLPFSLPVYYTPEISIGLGDFFFFSVLVAKSVYVGLVTNNLWFYILPFLGILFGSYVTFQLLEKREMLPALPIPILIGTIGFLGALLLGYVSTYVLPLI